VNSNTLNAEQLLKKALNSAGQKAIFINFAEDKIIYGGVDLEEEPRSEFHLPTSFGAFLKYVNPMDVAAFTEALKLHECPSTITKVDVVDTDFRYRHEDGRLVRFSLKGELQQENGAIIFSGLLAEADEISGQQNNNAIRENSVFIRYNSVRDTLIEKIENVLSSNEKCDLGQKKGFMLLTGIDRFSLYNQAYGAQFVDSLLNDLEKKFCELLQSYNASIVRFSGDQYVFFFGDMYAEEMDHTARQILDRISNISLPTLKGNIRMSFSMGGVTLDQKLKHSGDYIVKAETALNASKIAGRGRFTSYMSDVSSTPLDTRKLLKSADNFLQAYEDGRFKLAFQPVIQSNNDEVSFYECLLRIVDEQEKLIPAGVFMSKIEDFGLVHIADQFALHQAIEELTHYPKLILSVNVSNASLSNPVWLRSVVSLLSGKRSVAERLIIEITETSVMHNIEHSKAIIGTLKDLGCRIALDDFGSGYTSFHQMREIKPDILKIDGYFSTELHLKENQVFIDAIQMLANGFDLETVAEGAETLTDVELLKDKGVHNVQGYAYGRPSVNRLWLPRTLSDIEIA
jgi:diguanylate cyclase (GGDEF)-like protein